MTSLPTRRNFLQRTGGGFGALALTHLLSQAGWLQGAATSGKPELNGGLHHRPKVKRIIQLFMNGGVSQMDTFDFKPELVRLHGQKFDPGQRVEAATSTPGNLMKCPFDWKQHGQSGRWVTSVLPHMAGIVDELTFLMSMASKTNVHGPASYMQNTGFITPGFPCMGSWISYALGNVSENLPSFVVMPDPRGLPYNNKGNFSPGFLPASNAGTILKIGSSNPIPDLFPPPHAAYINPASEKESQELLKKLNEQHLQEWGGDHRLDARIESYELAAKMQLSAPEAFDLGKESEATKESYGISKKETQDFGTRCLLARRLVERGVRFVQVWSGAGGAAGNWDNHNDIPKDLPSMCVGVDQPIAALVRDLKQRGLFEETLVIWTTEFGRMPFTQGEVGRYHNGGTFVTWMAGAGLKPGVAFGESDPWSWKAQMPIYCYDLHATVLHLLGIDHEKLTFRHNGSDRRLTDVHGHVLEKILI